MRIRLSILEALVLIVVASAPVGSAQIASVLPDGGRHSIVIDGAKSSQLRVAVPPGQFLELTVSVWQTDAAVVTLQGLSGEPLFRFHPIGDLHDAYRLPLAATGEYVLTVKGSGPQTVFEVTTQQRPAVSSDEERIRLAQRLINALDRFTVGGGKEPPGHAITAAREFREWCKSFDADCVQHANYLSGNLYFFAGQLDLARRDLDAAQQGDRIAADDVSRVLAVVEQRRGNLRRAIDLAREATEAASSGNSRYSESYILNVYCSALAAGGRMAEARPRCNQALEIARREGFELPAAKAKLQLAQIDIFNGEGQADRFAAEAIASFHRFGNTQSEAFGHLTLASIHQRQNSIEGAIENFIEALRLSREASDPWIEAAALTSLGSVYTSIGDGRKAVAFYEQALALARRTHDPEGEVQAILRLASAYRLPASAAEGILPDRILELYNQALSRAREIPHPGLEADALVRIGELLGDRKEWDQAVARYEQAVAIYRQNNRRPQEAEVLGLIGGTFWARKQYDQAEARYREALAIRLETGNRMGAAILQSALSRLRREQGKFQEAKRFMAQALETVETQRGRIANPALRVTYFNDVRAFYDEYIDLLMEMHQTDANGGYLAAAFDVSELARARVLLDATPQRVQDLTASIPSELIAQEKALRAKIEESERSRSSPVGSLDLLLADYDRLQTAIQQRSPSYRALVAPPPLEWPQISAWLPEDAALIEYKLGPRRSFVWVVSRTGGIRAEVLPGYAALTKIVDSLYDAQSASATAEADQRYWTAAAALSEAILKPIWDQVAHKKRLYVVADGPLHQISFAALPVPDGQGSPRPLIAGQEVVAMPSASVAVAIEATQISSPTRSRGLIAFGDTVLGVGRKLPPLPATAGEVQSILGAFPAGTSRAYLKYDANLYALAKEDLTQYRFLHFATHAWVNPVHPELSEILLSEVDAKGNPQRGSLRLMDVYNLRVRADLVVLSACKSAVGNTAAGEGMMGLARGFMYAGSRNVIATLWDVKARFPKEMMDVLYKSLTGPQKRSVVASFRQAQLSMWREGRSPRDWAAFVLYVGGKGD